MRVESHHGDARLDDAEVLFQRAAERMQVAHDLLPGDAAADLRHRNVLGDQPHAQNLAAHDHHRLPAQFGPDEFGMAREVEPVALHALLVEGGCDDGVEQPLLQLLRRAAQRLDGGAPGLGRSFARFDLLRVAACDEVHFAAAGVAGRRYGVELHRFGLCERISVIGGGFRRSVDDGGEELRHARIGERLEDDLPADAVRVALRDAYFEFLF